MKEENSSAKTHLEVKAGKKLSETNRRFWDWTSFPILHWVRVSANWLTNPDPDPLRRKDKSWGLLLVSFLKVNLCLSDMFKESGVFKSDQNSWVLFRLVGLLFQCFTQKQEWRLIYRSEVYVFHFGSCWAFLCWRKPWSGSSFCYIWPYVRCFKIRRNRVELSGQQAKKPTPDMILLL